MEIDLADNTALVTASSSGLGKASATALAEAGANVVVNGRDESKLADAVDDIRATATGDVVGCAGDLTDPEFIDALVETTVAEFGGLDHLVTNAGGPPSGAFLETSDEDWYNAYDLLVMSVVRLIRASVDHLRASDAGTIVTIASRSVKEVIPSLVLSNSVRMGVIGLEKTLSKELAPDIRVNAVLPGPHATDRMVELVEDSVESGDYESYDEALENRTESIPLNRMGDPRELGDVVAFLSSPYASYVTGTALLIDGGLSNATL